jgi:hypothetical protein
MKKKLALAFLLAAAGGAFLFGAGSPSILSPQPPAPAVAAPPPAKASRVAAKPPASKGAKAETYEVRGRIIKVYPADKARKTAEWIVVLVGKKRLSVVVYAGTSIKDGKGARLGPATLKAGESVDLSYRQKGKARTALSIRV